MNIRTATVRSAHIALGAGVVLRVVLEPDPELGDRLILMRGYGADGEPFRKPHWSGEPLVLPATALPELRAALEALEGER